MDRKYLYNDKVEQTIGEINPSRSYLNQEAVLKCFNRYRDRIKMSDPQYAKEDSFIYALHHSYNSETIVLMNDDLIDEEKTKYLALINQGEKELLLSAPLELNLKVGSFIKWLREDAVCLVTKQYITEKSYFKADIKKANFLIKWEDDKDNVYESWAVVTGPPETRFKSEQESTFYMDRANDSIDVWLPQNKNTETLRRYKKLIIKGKAWTINIVDDITSDRLLKLNCVESYINTDKDDISTGVVGGKDVVPYRLISALDGLREINVGKTIWFDPVLYRDGVIVNDVNFNYTVESLTGADTIIEAGDGGFETIGVGTVRVEIKPDGYPIESVFIINVVPQVTTDVVRFGIEGVNKIKQGFTATYTVEKFVNGEKVQVPEGQFTLSNRNVKVNSKSGNTITLEGTKIGTTVVHFDNGYEQADIEIEITSLFG